MSDQQDPYERLQRIEQAVSLLAAAVAEMKRDLSPPSAEPPPDRRRHLRPLAALIALPVGAWALLRERVQATLVAAGAATVMVTVGWLASQGPNDVPGAAPTVTVTRFPSATPTTAPEDATSPVPPSDREVSPPREDHAVEEEGAADEPAPTPPPVDDEPGLTPPPPDVVTPPPGGSGDGVEEVVRAPRRCLTLRVADLPIRVCRR